MFCEVCKKKCVRNSNKQKYCKVCVPEVNKKRMKLYRQGEVYRKYQRVYQNKRYKTDLNYRAKLLDRSRELYRRRLSDWNSLSEKEQQDLMMLFYKEFYS